MACADNRGHVKQTKAGCVGLLMAQMAQGTAPSEGKPLIH